METTKILFNCIVAIDYKKRILIIDRKLCTFEDEDDLYHQDNFDETNILGEYETQKEVHAGMYHCDIYLVYETIQIQGGQGGTEYNSYLEFGELILIHVIDL